MCEVVIVVVLSCLSVTHYFKPLILGVHLLKINLRHFIVHFGLLFEKLQSYQLL